MEAGTGVEVPFDFDPAPDCCWSFELEPFVLAVEGGRVPGFREDVGGGMLVCVLCRIG